MLSYPKSSYSTIHPIFKNVPNIRTNTYATFDGVVLQIVFKSVYTVAPKRSVRTVLTIKSTTITGTNIPILIVDSSPVGYQSFCRSFT